MVGIFQFDLDGVLFDNVSMIIKLACDLYGMKITPQDIKSFGMSEIFTPEQVKTIIHHPIYVAEQMPTKNSVRLTNYMFNLGWMVMIGTARPESERKPTEQSLKTHGFSYDSLEMGLTDKGDYAMAIGAEYAVDDSIENIRQVTPYVRLAFLYRPDYVFYNQGEVGDNTMVISNLMTILDVV